MKRLKAPLELWRKLSGAHWEMVGLTAVFFDLFDRGADLLNSLVVLKRADVARRNRQDQLRLGGKAFVDFF